MKTANRIFFPMVFLGMMFFVIGFALGINSYLVPLLNNVFDISSGKSYLVIAATFSAFLVLGYPSSYIISKIGYKLTMALSFLLFALGFYLFILSAEMSSFSLFLVASFVSGAGNTFLQSSVNPYVTIVGPLESAAQRISIMGICNKLAWPVAPIFLAAVIGKDIEYVALTDINLPFYIIIGIFLALGFLVLLINLPDVKAVGEEKVEDCPYAQNKKSIWQFPHLLLGCLTLFLYVGVETLALSTAVDYATFLKLNRPEDYAIFPSIGLVLGYICGIIFIPKYISQQKALIICTIIALAGSLLLVLTPPAISVYSFFIVALGCSMMWPALWPLAIVDLGRFTKKGSALLVTAIVGGAVIPLIFGFLKDGIGAQTAYWLMFPCFLFILYYGIAGNKIRK